MTDSLIVAFTRDLTRRNLAVSTIEDRRRLLNRFLKNIQPDDERSCTQADIERWLDGCSIGPRSRYSYISSFACYFGWLVEMGHRDDDPTVGIRRPKLGRLLPRPVGEADLQFALESADPRMRAWLALAAFDGLRCGEIANLRREDVIDDQVPPLLIVRQGKGGKDRILPLNPVVEEALRAYGLRRGWLFTLNDGRHIGPRTLSCYIGRYLRGLGIASSAHRARHKFGTDVYRESGGDLRLTQEMLGHGDPKTTAIYADFDRVKAAAVVGMLGSSQPRVAR